MQKNLLRQYCPIFRQIYTCHCIAFYCVASFSIVLYCIINLLLGEYNTMPCINMSEYWTILSCVGKSSHDERVCCRMITHFRRAVYNSLHFMRRLNYRIQGHLFTSYWITIVPIVFRFVLQKVLTHVKQTGGPKWPCIL